jgi:predicted AAA+ superfamily ATPase
MAGIYLKRRVDGELSAWKSDKKRKVLLLRGARQVGKSSSVRNLAKKFDHFLEVNFEDSVESRAFFEGDLDVKKICERLSFQYKVPVIPGKTLLFLDEIQSCPRAITSLRYFYEKYPELHVVAAGSLLEFVLQELPSFGVGRIQMAYMHPLSYGEFLWAFGEDGIWGQVLEASPWKPLPEPFHNKCLEYLRKYLVIGGMPEVVANYAESGDILGAQNMLDNLADTLKSDFAKYSKRVPDLRIAVVFEAAVRQSGGRFNYAKVEDLNYRQVKQCLRLLEDAGILTPVIHSAANGIPLGGEINPKKQKFLLPDTGILQRMQGLQLSDILLGKDISMINKGAVAEQFAGLELRKASRSWQNCLYFWSREKAHSNAEVDYVVQRGEKIIPIEVKSGSTGQMQSMHVFLKEKNAEYGIRASLENFSAYGKIRVYPLYAVGNILGADS